MLNGSQEAKPVFEENAGFCVFFNKLFSFEFRFPKVRGMEIIKARKFFKSFGALLLTLICLFLFMHSPSFAVDYYWTGGSGSWGDPSNWSPNGVPGAGPPYYHDDAYLLSSDAVSRTVDVSNSYRFLAGLTIDGMGTGAMTLSLQSPLSNIVMTPSTPVTSPNFLLGTNGIGIVNQSDGSVTVVTGNIQVGSGNPGSMGVYNMSGGTLGLGAGSNFLVGATGIFNQTGGYVWDNDPSLIRGVYNLINGTFSSNDLVVGDFSGNGSGIFNQQGGSHFAVASIYVNKNSAYNLSGGSLTGGSILNNGTFNYSGGTVDVSRGERFPE